MGKAVHTCKRCGAVHNVSREFCFVVKCRKPGLIWLPILPDTVTYLAVDALPIITPCEFINEFSSVSRIANLPQDLVSHFSQGENAVAKVGGEARDIASQIVSTAFVALRLYIREKSACRNATTVYLA